MKKQFMRYRLVAEQKVGRANKSEVLNDELLQVEKHIEHVRASCQSTYKKLSHCMQTHGIGDYDKRLKRVSENTLALAMTEASTNLLSDGDAYQGFGYSLEVCAKAQGLLAKEKVIYEMFVDEHIIGPLQALVETEIPAIQKQREKLKRLVLDRDGFHQNYMKANKALSTPGASAPQAAANVDVMKEKYEQAVMRMEQCKDQLVTEMYEYLSKEVGHSQRIADFHAKQLDYHRRCVSHLEKLEPEMKEAREKTVLNSSFGQSIGEHLKTTEREIASPLEACILFLLEYGLKEEGIFRIAGGSTKLKKVRSLVDGGVLDLSLHDAQDDVHAVAGALKQYLRELPDPLLTHQLHDRWVAIPNVQDSEQKLNEIQSIINDLPPDHRANLRYLIKFCGVVAEYHEVNKMTPSNLAVVLGPNLLWSNIDDIGKRMVLSNITTGVVELMITNVDRFFPGEFDFVATPNATSYQLSLPVLSTGEMKQQPPAAILLSPPATAPKSATPSGHSRNPSGDANSPANYSNSSGTLRSRKQKSKAPPPPQTQAPPKIPPPAVPFSPPPIVANEGSSTFKPPVAAKRSASVRKPHLPPPPNPKEGPLGEERPSSGVDGIVPVPRPRPPVRKPTGHPASLIEPPPNPKASINNIAYAHEPSTADEHNNRNSPPLPSIPPPPLPVDVEADLGASLLSELHFSSN